MIKGTITYQRLRVPTVKNCGQPVPLLFEKVVLTDVLQLSNGDNHLVVALRIKTDNPGTSKDNQFRLPAVGNFVVDWGDGRPERWRRETTHTYAAPGEYMITMSGNIQSILFKGGGDLKKVLEIRTL